MENASYFFSFDLSIFLGMLWWKDCPGLLTPSQYISPKYVRCLNLSVLSTVPAKVSSSCRQCTVIWNIKHGNN